MGTYTYWWYVIPLDLFDFLMLFLQDFRTHDSIFTKLAINFILTHTSNNMESCAYFRLDQGVKVFSMVFSCVSLVVIVTLSDRWTSFTKPIAIDS